MEPNRDLLRMYFSDLLRSSNIKSVVIIFDNASTSNRQLATQDRATLEQNAAPPRSLEAQPELTLGNCNFHQYVIRSPNPNPHKLTVGGRGVSLLVETRTE